MDRQDRLRLKIFADGADFDGILAMYQNLLIKGFTTNPSVMRKAGVTDYEDFARRLLAAVPDRPISFEVFAGEPREMVRQARGHRFVRTKCQRKDSGNEHAARIHRPGYRIRDTAMLATLLVGQDAVLPTMRVSSSTSACPRLSITIALEPLVIAAKHAGVKRFVYCSSSSVYGVRGSSAGAADPLQ
jgi:hypothetical protein